MKEISRREFLKGMAASAVTVAGLGMINGKEMVAAADAMYTPGTYTASARGIDSDVVVTMTFDENAITDVMIDVSGETPAIGGRIGESMAAAIKEAQSCDIDAVAGATTTSNAIKKAAAECIAQATGKPVEVEAKEDGAADWLGMEPEIAPEDISEVIECEVLVVGSGHSGAFAAAAAVEEGAKTILIERFDHDNASGLRDTLAACDSKEQLEDGDNVDKNVAINYLCNWSHGYTRRSLAKLWADNSGEMIDWFDERLSAIGYSCRHEIDEHDLPTNYEFLDVGHSTQYPPDGPHNFQASMDAIYQYAIPLGLEIHYETTMIKLVKDGDRVCGVIAKNAEGKYVCYAASKGVIMATGGYSNNMDMVSALQPWTVEQIGINYSKPGSKGDGIKACLWAGAIMDTTHSSMIFDRAAVKPDQVGVSGESVPGAWFWMGSQPFLKVNLEGKRFMNEYQPYDYILHQAAMQPNHTYATIWDEKYPADIERFATHGCSRLYPHVNGTDPVFPMFYIKEIMNAGLIADGYIQVADTIEELAEKLNLPVEELVKTVDRYNELAEKGEDEDFGKEGYRMSTLDTPPFYGTRQCGGYFICTMDGIQIDDNMHAIDKDYKAIPGLYVVGDCSGNYFSESYPNLMGGAAAGRSATFGRLAGKNAAKGI